MKKAEAELERRERDNSTRSGFNEWLVFYKGCNSDNPFMYGAKNISGSDFIDTEVPGSEWCSWKYEQNRLKNVPLGDGTWNDVISKISWDLLDDPILGPWSSSGKYELAVFKHSNFPSAPCEREIIDFPYPIGSSNCLNSEYWCAWPWSGDLNDDISSWRMAFCESYWDFNASCDCFGPYSGT
jgi:hypothetical protein